MVLYNPSQFGWLMILKDWCRDCKEQKDKVIKTLIRLKIKEAKLSRIVFHWSCTVLNSLQIRSWVSNNPNERTMEWKQSMYWKVGSTSTWNIEKTKAKTKGASRK